MIDGIDRLHLENEFGIEEFGDFGRTAPPPPTPIVNQGANATTINVLPGGNNEKGSRKKQEMDSFLASCNEMMSANVEKIISANKLMAAEPDPKEVMKCLKEIDFDRRYKRKAYIHLCRNRVDFNMIMSLELGERGPTLWDIMVLENIISADEMSPYGSFDY